jgi:hypothetical protein
MLKIFFHKIETVFFTKNHWTFFIDHFEKYAFFKTIFIVAENARELH